MKHALWLQLLARLTMGAEPLRVIDTHAGAGRYDLQDEMARRSKEAEAGVARLMAAPDAPAVFAPLRSAVLAENTGGALRFYPGSPLLTVAALRKGDRYDGCELRADDQQALQALLDGRRGRQGAQALAVLADGYDQLHGPGPGGRAKWVYLIDPPFERADEYDRIVAGLGAAMEARGEAVFAIWAPLKDLETFDALLRRIEALAPSSLLVAQVRLRPLRDPMRMNGCAMILIGAPDMQAEAAAICDWVARRCGEHGSAARVSRFASKA